MIRNREKLIQDPVHGYITIKPEFVNILNSIQFQRLKHVNQSSFRVLYPGATHDRFIHSLGTYHLAEKAIQNFLKNIKEDINNDILCLSTDTEELLSNTFLYASLLHDVGHAPFSHTGEKFFARKRTEDSQMRQIDVGLLDAIRGLKEETIISENVYQEFVEEYKGLIRKNGPSPHEIVSATMLIKDRKEFWKEDSDKIDYELATRMVIGLKYDPSSGNEDYRHEKEIRNCLINLLNSKCLDVDKLDYICRDTKMTGFSNVQVDIERITTAFTAVESSHGYELAFRKNMLSVIENVFRAKVEQGTWLISHPAVVYENNLIERCIDFIDKSETSQKHNYVERVFSYEALTEQGICYRERNYRLLSDIDILTDFKHFGWREENEAIHEYFDRSRRRKPLWKSYKEFLYFFYEKDSNVDITERASNVYNFFKKLIDYLEDENEVLNKYTFKKIEKLKDDTEMKEIYERALLLKKICEKSNVEFDMALISVKNDFANKISTDDIYIKFSGNGDEALIPYKLLQDKVGEKTIPFFYIYNKQPLEKEWFRCKVLEACKGDENNVAICSF